MILFSKLMLRVRKFCNQSPLLLRQNPASETPSWKTESEQSTGKGVGNTLIKMRGQLDLRAFNSILAMSSPVACEESLTVKWIMLKLIDTSKINIWHNFDFENFARTTPWPNFLVPQRIQGGVGLYRTLYQNLNYSSKFSCERF